MTRRDYVMLAKTIKRCTTTRGTTKSDKPPTIAKDAFIGFLCQELKHDNPRFDEGKFRDACE